MTSRSEEAVPGIVERLRARALMHGDYDGPLNNPDGPEAADHIEWLTSALESARNAVEAAIEGFDSIASNCQGASICDGDDSGAHEMNFYRAMQVKGWLEQERSNIDAALAAPELPQSTPSQEQE